MLYSDFFAVSQVAGIAKPGNDISVFVQLFIERGREDLHVRMIRLNARNPFGRRDEADQLDVRASPFFQEANARGRGSAGARNPPGTYARDRNSPD